MPISLIFSAALAFVLCTTTLSFGQYGGGYGGGGYGGGGYGGGGRMGGMGNQQAGANFKPSLPNIAGDLANRETKWLKENLALTKEQGKDVKTLNNDYAKQQQEAIKEILGNGGTRPTELQTSQIKDAMMMYNEDKELKLKAVFTPDQWNTYQMKKDDMQREIGGIRPPAPKEFAAKKDSIVRAQEAAAMKKNR